MEFNAIYIVDPDTAFHSAIKKFTDKIGVNTPIFYFTNGDDFLKENPKSIDNSGNDGENLILLDLNAQNGIGWEFLKKFDGLNYQLKSTFQIVALSEELSLSERNQALAYQSVSFYFHKPFTYRGFITMVETIVNDLPSSI
ncbi:hypothetical protein SAMN04488519_10680 [Algoriphagus ornithinivorans]|uniref:Response regulatory domain-containing protein n=1 Tax=Algoriphagus ornithinivorans TaxID=226506 RepID=A0A1I5GV54_9BACT|nr:hypothetical protein [Algoriphagus ornithinivorans]SFO39763.1 hypothetical protein SAMN04488519_10680 [Algoriphagus ornithinivorans]